MKGTLAGRTIVITRPRDQAAALAGLLEARGAQPVIAPALEIAPVRTGVVRRAMEELEADEFDWITLTSRATVEMLAEYLRPGAVRAKVAVVGEGTAAAFERWARRPPDLVPREFTTAALARAMPKGTGRVLCPRADIAPHGFELALARKGWTPTRIDVYRTRAPRGLPAEARRALSGGVDAVTFTSASTVVGFARLAGAMKGSPKVVCIGPVTAREARTHGFRVDAVASPHTIGGVVAALERVFAPPASGHRRPVKETA